MISAGYGRGFVIIKMQPCVIHERRVYVCVAIHCRLVHFALISWSTH